MFMSISGAARMAVSGGARAHGSPSHPRRTSGGAAAIGGGRIINNERAHDRLCSIVRRDKRYISFGGEMDREDKYVAPTLLDFGDDMNKRLFTVLR
jgi:hypothetical protein